MEPLLRIPPGDGGDEAGRPSSGAEVLRQARIDAGYTQERLSSVSGLSARAIRDLEAGRTVQPRSSSLDELALALGMSGHAREAFRNSWGLAGRGVRLDPQQFVSTTDHRRVLASLAGRMTAFTTTYVRIHAFVGPSRTVEREDQERVVTADVNGLEVLPMAVSTLALHPSASTHVRALSACRVGAKTSIPDEKMDLYDVHLGRTLRRGDSWRYAVRIDLRGRPTQDRVDAAETRLSMFAIHHVESLAVFEVAFDVRDPPARCWTVFEQRLSGTQVAGPAVPVAEDGTAQYIVRHPELGWHGLRWSW